MIRNNSPLVIFDKGMDKKVEELGSRFQTTYFEFVCEVLTVMPVLEMSDEELLGLAQRNKEFSYLENSEENIYSLSDGTAL